MGWSVKSDRGLFPTTVAFDTPRALPGGSPQTDVGLAQKLRTDGYAVIDAKLPQVLLDACRACIDDSAKGVASLSAAHRHRDRYQGDHLFLGFSRADELREATIVDTVFAKLIACPQLLAAFAAVGVAQPAFWAGSIMSKPPGAPPLYWHHDWCAVPDSNLGHQLPMISLIVLASLLCNSGHRRAFWDRHELSRQPDPAQIFAMVYLTDTTVENGCLRVLPGSHRQRLPIHDALAALQADGKGPSHGSWETQAPWEEEGHGSPLFSKCDGHEVEPVDVQVQAGQLVLGDARVLHCTHPNKSLV
eukprot:SAG31_NODE_1142_length_9696_cov_3.874232_15_plen_303_part_00